MLSVVLPSGLEAARALNLPISEHATLFSTPPDLQVGPVLSDLNMWKPYSVLGGSQRLMGSSNTFPLPHYLVYPSFSGRGFKPQNSMQDLILHTQGLENCNLDPERKSFQGTPKINNIQGFLAENCLFGLSGIQS